MSLTVEIKRNYKSLKAIAISRSSNYLEAEEVLHDTLVRCIELKDKFKKGENLITWCVAIMKNIEKDRMRTEGRYKTRVHKIQTQDQNAQVIHTETNTDGVPIGDVLNESIFSPNTTGLETVKSISIRKDILECLKELSEIAQRAFLLNTVLEYRAREVAEALQEATNTVEQRLARSRKSVGLCLSQKMEAQT